VAKLGDGWLSVGEMGGYVGSAPGCYGSSLGSNPDISKKYKMGDISQGVANTLARQKNKIKKISLCMPGLTNNLQGIFLLPASSLCMKSLDFSKRNTTKS
jgi:hypothetical protein